MATDVVCNAGTGIPPLLGTFKVKAKFGELADCVLRT